MKYVNLDTGELLSSPEQRLRKHKIEYCVGIDIPFPDDCKDTETLTLCLRQIDSHLKGYTRVQTNTDYLLDSVAGKHSTFKAAQSCRLLADFCVGWNIGFISKSDLLKVGEITPKNFSRWIDEIRNFVKIEHIHLDHYRIVFNPVVVWKGDALHRESRLRQWYNRRTN